VASTALQVPPTYTLDRYVINSGNVIKATAIICIDKNGEKIEKVAVGDGPIDAAFAAVEAITGKRYELDDWRMQSVTEGQEAMGEAIVKIMNDGKVYSGRGISTDIVGSSIRAYLNALNKIVYEEEN
jgi:2-isopropylmalate synthase